MDRRVTGAVVLGLAVLLTALSVASSGPDVPGVAVAQPVRPVPRVGDCQLDATVSFTGFDLPSRALAPCAGRRAGEVTVVFPDYARAGVVVPGSPAPVDRCRQERAGYVGLPAEPPPDEWSYPVDLGADLVGPDARQRAAGQVWAACVVYPLGPTGETPGFAGPARDIMLRRGPDSAALSWCADDPVGPRIDCLTPHRVEVLGTTIAPAGTAEDELQPSCRDQIGALTGLPDPTADGALTVVGGMFAAPRGALSSTPLAAFCAVAVTDPARSLVSTLRNIGTDPLPWA